MARNAGVVGGATLASRVLGLVRDVVVANVFASWATDAFFIAFMIPNLLRRLVGEGSLTVAFVPVFTGWLERSRSEARRVFNATWTLAAAVGLLFAVAGILGAGALIDLFAPGFALEPGKRELAVTLLRLCFPYILFLMLVAVAMGALNALRHFLAPAIAPVLLNLCLIAGAICGPFWFDPPILGLGVGVIAAGVLQVLLQVPPLRRRGMAPVPVVAPGHPALRRLGALMAPAVLGASVLQINVLVSRLLSSFLGDGAVSYLYYADRLLELPLGVFVFALGTASLPSFSRLAKRGDAGGTINAFTGTLGLTVALALPSSVGLVLLREPIFAVLFAWNPQTFGSEAVQGCAGALLWYAIGIVPIAVARVVVMLSVAHENTRVPAQGAVVGVVVHLLACLALIGPLPAGSLPGPVLALQGAVGIAALGYPGLALAASIASLANATYVWIAVRVRYGRLVLPEFAGRAVRLVLASAVMAAAVLGLERLLPARGVASLLAHVAVGASVYVAVLAALRSPELSALRSVVSRRQQG